MNYYIYKLEFPVDVHFGAGNLNYSQSSFCADTLFSALCQEALQGGSERLERLVSDAREGRLLLSDALPFIGEEYFLPKPFLHIESRNNEGSSTEKKIFKKMDYVPADLLEEYLNGRFPLDRAEDIHGLGHSETRTKAAIRGQEETTPYRVGVFRFAEGAGLYLLVGTDKEETAMNLEELLEGLSLSGIGGERSSGLGRFTMHREKVLGNLLRRLQDSYQIYMTLSVGLPRDEELEQTIECADYMLQKRSGFVASTHYSPEYMRKRDLYVFQAGSCFRQKFAGDVYDVSSGGAHPVYRYARPILLGVIR